jgi:hypothetical protein
VDDVGHRGDAEGIEQERLEAEARRAQEGAADADRGGVDRRLHLFVLQTDGTRNNDATGGPVVAYSFFG